MAVIWRTKYGDKYVNPGNAPPSGTEIEQAKQYDKFLEEKLGAIKSELIKRGFFNMKTDIKKWYILGQELQFLEELPLRKSCDPDMTMTWRALYDIMPDLSPTGKLPTEKERAEGARNHYLMCYRLAKFDSLEAIEKSGITWREFNDIYMSFGPAQWKDRKRLLEWIGLKTKNGKEKTRAALQAIRRVSGMKSVHKTDTTILSKEELFKILDAEMNKDRGS